MSDTTDWSPDEPQGTEVFEQGDEALDDREALDPAFGEDVELDPSLDPTLAVDDRELEEAGAGFDDPERLATLPGGGDDPDGVGVPIEGEDPIVAGEDEEWQLDAAEGPLEDGGEPTEG
jgi:hypothetical protein